MPRLEAWLRPCLAEVLPGVAGRLDVLQFPNGSANLTYLLRIGTHERWALARFDDSPAEMDEIHQRLVRGMPAPSRVSIVHNDLKLDNCAHGPADPRMARIADRIPALIAAARIAGSTSRIGHQSCVRLNPMKNYWRGEAS